ncbi:MAG TPA: carbamoyltransferase HypF [Deltaproteobacteria bacterium]|nr:carbamoyltransferase HypF [Deltaproteobacteria bacterium]
MERRRARLVIKGIVQGVGFRPFVYGLAARHGLGGFVRNDGRGVTVEVEGAAGEVEAFCRAVEKGPPMAAVFEVEVTLLEPAGYGDFTIRESRGGPDPFVPVPPELATCEECLRELFDPRDRRYRYPFINCTDCGPRFTIVVDVPYDRALTTMADFEMCPLCRAEYEDPLDRRFHAQPNACPRCGPRLRLVEPGGGERDVEDPAAEAARLVRDGAIAAVKGLGGYHLCCNALDEEAVSRLRSLKDREEKPFAVMAAGVEQARGFCAVGPEEERLLTGPLRPIVLLERAGRRPLAPAVAPGQRRHGVMLPYTPLHHLLLRDAAAPLVMTSANRACEPIAYRDDEAMERLAPMVDFLLVHNRRIETRTDDSVAARLGGKTVPLRRSRGYVPMPLRMPLRFERAVLACGGDLKNTFCLGRDGLAFLSHHIGDLEDLATLRSFEEGIEHFRRLFRIEPEVAAFDLHPRYLSTRYALALDGVEKAGVQHHHGHIASCMADNMLDGEVIGVAFDGTGYGPDGTVWGGEALVASYDGFERLARLDHVALAGGDRAVVEPWRTALAWLHKVWGEEAQELEIDLVEYVGGRRWRNTVRMISGGVNSPLTSSAGRLFDAAAALAGVGREVRYEGQAAMEFEALADRNERGRYGFDMEARDGLKVVILDGMWREMVNDIRASAPVPLVSARFHNTVAAVVAAMAESGRRETGLDRVCLSGGVFQNGLLVERAAALLERKGLRVFTHGRVPPNDGGLCLGQAAVAARRRPRRPSPPSPS